MTENKSNEAGDKPTPTISFDELSPETQAMFRNLQAKSKVTVHGQ